MTDTKHYVPTSLIALDSSTKVIKGRARGYATGILYLAPSNESKVMNTCKFASKGCREACLYTAGMAKAFPKINQARINKTKFLFNDAQGFFEKMVKDIEKHLRKCKKLGLTFACRLNGTSDINFINLKNSDGKNIFDLFPQVQFYDYTKNYYTVKDYIDGKLPVNYHITFSRSESKLNHKKVNEFLGKVNVAIVFLGDLPKTYKGIEVVNGDIDDLRFLDKQGVIIGLKAKGKAKKDESGFCVSSKVCA